MVLFNSAGFCLFVKEIIKKFSCPVQYKHKPVFVRKAPNGNYNPKRFSLAKISLSKN